MERKSECSDGILLYKLFLDNYEGQPNGKGEEHWSEVRVEVEPPSVQTAFMDCSNLVLSAERGNLILDMSCEVYFTNPTDVEWRITDVVTEARILKGQCTQEITPEFSDTLLTPTVPAKGTGRLQVNFHDTLPASGFLGKSVKIGDLAGVSVPVEVDLTLEVNGKTYVVDSQGNTWSLKYKAIKMVKIKTDTDNVTRDLVGELTLGLAGAVAGTIAGAKIGAALGSVVPGAGTVTGAIVGGIVGFIGGLLLHEKLGWP
ncbi:hypothetical protein [Pyrococcus kukulkanii]|uniref:hypothetical protein n=1 Tax=Pyrococcus kukulkanii TaxID=1609559 RepID=UPI0035697AC1